MKKQKSFVAAVLLLLLSDGCTRANPGVETGNPDTVPAPLSGLTLTLTPANNNNESYLVSFTSESEATVSQVQLQSAPAALRFTPLTSPAPLATDNTRVLETLRVPYRRDRGTISFEATFSNGRNIFVVLTGVSLTTVASVVMQIDHVSVPTTIDINPASNLQTASNVPSGPSASFNTGTPQSITCNPSAAYSGDFNGDNKIDLVVGGFGTSPDGSQAFCVLYGNGDGSFTSPRVFSTTDPGASRRTLSGDFNGDGLADVATLSIPLTGNSTIEVALGHTDGNFSAKVHTDLGRHFSPNALLAATSLGSNGRQDFILAESASGTDNCLTTGQCQIFPFASKNDATFDALLTLNRTINLGGSVAVDRNTFYILLADFNHDVIEDFLVPNIGTASAVDNSMSLFPGVFGGTFQTAIKFSSDRSTSLASHPSFAVADFNGDNKLDIAITSSEASGSTHSTVRVLLGNGNGTFRDPLLFDIRGINASEDKFVTTGDFNGDGKPDIAIASISGQIILLSNTNH